MFCDDIVEKLPQNSSFDDDLLIGSNVLVATLMR
jgi:hypothetical protein